MRILQLSKEVEQQREAKKCSCDEDINQHSAHLEYFKKDMQAVAAENKISKSDVRSANNCKFRD